MRIRHVAICTGSPWETEAKVTEILGLALVSRDKFDPAIGIRNGLFALQTTFLEVTTPGAPDTPTQRFLDRRGDGGYMVCLQVADLEAARARAEAMGVRVVLHIDRHRSGDQTVSAVHLHPADTGGTLFSFEQADPPDSWAYAGEAWRDYRRGETVRDIVGVDLASPEPERLARRLGQLFGVEPTEGVLPLAGSRIRLLPAPAGETQDKLLAVEFAATDAGRIGEEHHVAGVVLRFAASSSAQAASVP